MTKSLRPTLKQAEARRLTSKKYSASPKGKANRMRYYRTPKGQLCWRKSRIKTKNHTTLEEYNNKLSAQHGLCAICCRPETTLLNGQIKRLAIDHNHITGKVRGLLCDDCNRGIGLLQGDKDTIILKQAIKYILGEELCLL